MVCLSPQLVIDGPDVACGCCQGCIVARMQSDRDRRLYWFKKRGGKRV